MYTTMWREISRCIMRPNLLLVRFNVGNPIEDAIDVCDTVEMENFNTENVVRAPITRERSINCLHQYLHTHTEIRNLEVDDNTSHGEFLKYYVHVVPAIQIRGLMFTGVINDTNTVQLSNYITQNTSLYRLSIYFHEQTASLECQSPILAALAQKTNLKHLWMSGKYSPVIYRDRDIAFYENIVRNNTQLHYLSIQNFMPPWAPMVPQEKSTKSFLDSVVESKSLTALYVELPGYAGEDKLIDSIQFNTKLLVLELRYPQQGRYPDREFAGKINELRIRNKMICWKNVHGILLDFALIFHTLPAYVLLEIYDWLPYMQMVRHYKKIQLIIGILKSIQLIKADGLQASKRLRQK